MVCLWRYTSRWESLTEFCKIPQRRFVVIRVCFTERGVRQEYTDVEEVGQVLNSCTM